MLGNTRETYGWVAQLFHWVTAILILIMLPLGVYMTDLPQETAEQVAQKAWFFSLHKTIGVTVLFVAIARVLWAIVQPHPRLINPARKMESLAAQTVHWLLYGAIIMMPLTGWLQHSAAEGFAPFWLPLPQDLPFVPKSPLLAELFGIAHVFMALLITLAIGLHIAGALKHALLDRDGTLRRMIPGLRPPDLGAAPDPGFRPLPVALAVLAFALFGAAVAIDFRLETTGGGVDLAGDNGALASESAWAVIPKNSRLEIQIIQMGNPVSGEFQNWNAAIQFDPDHLETANVKVDVDVASILIGSVSDQAKGPNFLNASAFPVAQFLSNSFSQTGPDTYEAQGELSLAGHSQPLVLPFSLTIEQDRASMQGEVTIERLAFGIGEKGFSDESQLGFGVLVKVTLEAEKVLAD